MRLAEAKPSPRRRRARRPFAAAPAAPSQHFDARWPCSIPRPECRSAARGRRPSHRAACVRRLRAAAKETPACKPLTQIRGKGLQFERRRHGFQRFRSRRIHCRRPACPPRRSPPERPRRPRRSPRQTRSPTAAAARARGRRRRTAASARACVRMTAKSPRWTKLPLMAQTTAVSAPRRRRSSPICQAWPRWNGLYSLMIPAVRIKIISKWLQFWLPQKKFMVVITEIFCYNKRRMYWSVGQIPAIPISILPEIGAHCKTPPHGKRRKQHECSGHQRRKLFPEVSASQSRHRRAARQGAFASASASTAKFTYKPQLEGQGGHQGRRRRHAHPQRSHRRRPQRPRGREERRHRLHEGDRRGRSPRGPRRREVRQVRRHHRRGHGRHRGVQSPRALHNPANIIGIKACQQLMPGVPMVAVFDTAFHQTMPPVATPMPFPMSITRTTRSAATASTAPATVCGLPRRRYARQAHRDLKLISCHLGNGSSVTAVDGGKSVETSMGFTPLAGLPWAPARATSTPAFWST